MLKDVAYWYVILKKACTLTHRWFFEHSNRIVHLCKWLAVVMLPTMLCHITHCSESWWVAIFWRSMNCVCMCIHMYVWVMYKNIQYEGWGWMQANLSAVFDIRSHPEYCIFHTSWVNGASINLFFVGRISSSNSDGPVTWCIYK